MRTPISLAVLLLVLSLSLPALTQSERGGDILNEITITAINRTYVLSEPRGDAEFIRSFELGADESAFGHDADGIWLRILDGWVLAELFETTYNISLLPDTTHSITGTLLSAASLYDGPSTRWFEIVGEIETGANAIVIGRNEDGTWLQLPWGWVEANAVDTDGDIFLLPAAPSGVIITAKWRTFILSAPALSADFIDVFEAGQEALSIDRNGDGKWLEISKGWLPAEAVAVDGAVLRLPLSGEGIPLTLVRPISSKVAPGPGTRRIHGYGINEVVYAIGRDSAGFWLQLFNGWIYVGTPSKHGQLVKADGDVMALPVTTSFETRRSAKTPTPAPESNLAVSLDARTIRTLVIRHSEDVRILNFEITDRDTKFEYDLRPWPFVPNEQIANEVAFKIICAIRNGQNIPNTIKLIGQSHFKSEIGRKFTSPSVEIHISASNANRIVCSGNSATDINWRSIASLYKSFPIPRGAKVDYD